MAVTLSPTEYIRRVIVETSAAFGRPVLSVAADPFALTLWSWGELRAIAREEAVHRLGERVDAAAMTAKAFHDPKLLARDDARYQRAAGLFGLYAERAKEEGAATLAALRAVEAARAAAEGGDA